MQNNLADDSQNYPATEKPVQKPHSVQSALEKGIFMDLFFFSKTGLLLTSNDSETLSGGVMNKTCNWL